MDEIFTKVVETKEFLLGRIGQESPEVGIILGTGLGDLGNRLWAQPAVPLPPDCYMMMGDNRSESLDGRFWGMTQRWRIIGRADVVFFPPQRWKLAR